MFWSRSAEQAICVAATVMMLVEELRVNLPGEHDGLVATSVREAGELAEEEYERRTDGVAVEQAAAIAVEISDERRKEESRPPEAAEASDPASGIGIRDGTD